MKDLMQQTIEAIAAYESALTMLGQMDLVGGYVVCCQNVYLTFDVSEDGYVFNPRPCPPHKARSFTAAQAEVIAEGVRNGDKVRGHAVHIIQAVTELLDRERAVLEALEEISLGVALPKASDLE